MPIKRQLVHRLFISFLTGGIYIDTPVQQTPVVKQDSAQVESRQIP